MFVKDVFKSVAKAFSHWLRPSKSSSKRAISTLHLCLSPYKKRPLPDLKRKLFALFYRINAAAGRALPSVLLPSPQRPETEGLKDLCKSYSVSEEIKGTKSVFYPFYLALWAEPIIYQCNFIV